ncbi:MAG TPA: glycosyltransferase [Hyphomicrobium sp.]|nr:glycosyltransferase [Hyphomicrobium sp.]
MTYFHHKRRAVLVACQGTRGDIQPFLAVAQGLKDSGYEPIVAAANDYQAWIEAAGFGYRRLGRDVKAWILEKENARKFTSSPLSVLINMGELLERPLQDQLDDLITASEGVSAILFSVLSHLACDLAEARKLPAAALLLQPAMPTRHFPSALLPYESMGPWLNRLSSAAALRARFLSRHKIIDWRRNVLGLPPKPASWAGFTIAGRPIHRIYGFSRHVLPIPSDWSDMDHVVGYWFYDPVLRAEPSSKTAQSVSAFLASGPKPIYVGFGSMPVPDAQENLAMLKESLRRLGMRAIISRGWAGLELGPTDHDQFYSLGDAPHSWIFERVDALVHHGGAGSIATGLRAGLPTLVCALGFDQLFWGHRIASIEAGPKPLPMRNWSPARLDESLRALTSTSKFRQAAQAIGNKLQAEDGVANAVACICDVIGDP